MVIVAELLTSSVVDFIGGVPTDERERREGGVDGGRRADLVG